jgi:hypothetical protein
VFLGYNFIILNEVDGMVDRSYRGDEEQRGDENCDDAEVPPRGVPSNAQATIPKKINITPNTAAEAREWITSAMFPWIWRRVITNSNLWMAVATVAIAAATIVYTLYAGMQWTAMNQTLSEIQKQTPEIQKQAEVAQDQLAQAKADSAASSVATTRQLKLIQQQLIESRKAIRLEESPWIDVSKVASMDLSSGREQLGFEMMNYGKSPAFNVRAFTQYDDRLPTEMPPTFIWSESRAKGTGEIPPGGVSSIHIAPIPEDHVRLFKLDQIHAYLGLAIWYRDYWGVKHFDTFCEVFEAKTGNWVSRKPDHCED